MPWTFRTLAATFISVALLGCAARWNTNFPKMQRGLTRAQVDGLLGWPASAESGPENADVLFYRLASSPLDTDGSDTREYYVVFRDGQVIGYGEREDALTMQRSVQQFNAAWNAARLIAPTRVHVTGDVSHDISGDLEVDVRNK